LAFLAARFSLREREAAFLSLRPPLSLFPISASDRAVLANGTTPFCHKSGHRGRHWEPWARNDALRRCSVAGHAVRVSRDMPYGLVGRVGVVMLVFLIVGRGVGCVGWGRW
jgi:hypothetical protein